MNFIVFFILAIFVSSLYPAREVVIELLAGGGPGLGGLAGLLLYALIASLVFGALPLVLGYFAAKMRGGWAVGLAVTVLVSAAQVFVYPKLFAVNDLMVGGVPRIVDRSAQLPMYVEECTVYGAAFILGWLAASAFAKRRRSSLG